MRILGIDYGDKKIGLSFGETDAKVAVPLEMIINKGDETLVELSEMVKEEQINLVVVGVPLPQGNHSSEQLEKTKAFIGKLKEKVSVPVKEEDESFTTAESIRLQQEEGTTTDEDALAAMLIVQAYINRTTN